MKKKIIVTVIALIIVITAVLSITTRRSSQKSETITSGTLTIGLEGTYAPFSYRQNGKLTGFEIELSTKIAKKLGLKP
ncbi:transporter substrate-binding domain-containing protein, partial [Leuconostoc suionicum]